MYLKEQEPTLHIIEPPRLFLWTTGGGLDPLGEAVPSLACPSQPPLMHYLHNIKTHSNINRAWPIQVSLVPNDAAQLEHRRTCLSATQCIYITPEAVHLPSADGAMLPIGRPSFMSRWRRERACQII